LLLVLSLPAFAALGGDESAHTSIGSSTPASRMQRRWHGQRVIHLLGAATATIT